MERTVVVDIIGWIFIALAGFAVLADSLHLMQVLPPEGIGLFRYLKVIIVTKLIVMSILLASSVGLLRRRNPARLVFIAVTLFCIAWSAVDMVSRTWLGVSVSLLPGGANHVHIGASFCLFSAWAVWTLTRPAVRTKFIGSLKV